ncbi:hypothetical protein, partial [Stutzerimonas stutzeri]|uniref:hypothetical protein n=3 Tax=Stutzerimonas TaxID=2901164 RepID=UPI003B437E3E
GDTEFVIGHSGSTVPERSGVALSFCGRPHKLVIHIGNIPIRIRSRDQSLLDWKYLFNGCDRQVRAQDESP